MKVVACHGGVGFTANLENLCAEALRETGTGMGAMQFLEEHPAFNCGFGSNLTIDGTVECEAGYMDGDSSFGGVAGATRLLHPSILAREVALKRYQVHESLVAPLMVFGEGTTIYAEKIGLATCAPKDLISEKALKTWKRNVDRLQGADPQGAQCPQETESTSTEKEDHQPSLDTVGAVELTDENEERVVACCSSGGISLKLPGRMGHSAVYGAGVYCLKDESSSKRVSVSVSGLGEAIIRTQLAQRVAQTLFELDSDTIPAQVMSTWLTENFTLNPLVRDLPKDRVLAGGIAVLQREEDEAELIIFYNTPYFPVAYKNKAGKVKTVKCERHASTSFNVISIRM